MPQFRANKFLGLAITERAMLLAEIVVAGPRREVRHLAEFPYPEGAFPADFATLGRPLAQFLRHQHITARHAIIGLPARWVMAAPKELPPADPTAAANLLRLQAEGAFSSELKDLVYDYAGQPDRSHPSTVLLMAVPRDRLTQLDAMAMAARLNVHAVTPSVAVLGLASHPLVGPDGLVVYLAGKSAELAAHNGHGLQRIRHITGQAGETTKSAASTLPAELLTELRRTLASMPATTASGTTRKLVLWDGTGLNDTGRRLLGDHLGLAIDTQPLTALGVTLASPMPSDPGRFAPAVALAAAGLDADTLAINFAHPRLAPRRETRVRTIMWSSILGAVVLGAIVFLLLDTQRRAGQVQKFRADLAQMQPALQETKALAKRLAFVADWRGVDSKFLNCLRQLTLAFPDDGTAWATNVDIQATLKGQLAAKVTSERAMFAIMDRLNADRKFKDVHLGWDGGKTGRDLSFSITFTFVGTE